MYCGNSNDDDVCAEAQELLSEWMNQKMRNDLLSEDEVGGDSSSWDAGSSHQFMEHCREVCGVPDYHVDNVDLSVMDSDSAVNTVIKKLMKTPISVGSTNDDSAFINKKKNPVLAMNIRHQQIKEAQVRRREETKRRQAEMANQREKKKMLRKLKEIEEQKRVLKEKMEEEAIQEEMRKIKFEIQLKKQQKKLAQVTSEENVDPNVAKSTASIPQQPIIPDKVPKDIKPSPSVMSQEVNQEACAKKEFINRVSLLQEFVKKQNIRAKRKCFNAWFRIVIDKQAMVGKAKALSDWKCMQVTWSAWRKYTLQQIAERSSDRFRQQIQHTKRLTNMADRQNRSKLLRKYFNGWRKFVKIKQFTADIQDQKEKTKAKMQAFLEALHTKSKQDLIVQSLEDGKVSDEDDENAAHGVEVVVKASYTTAGSSNQSSAVKPSSKQAWQLTTKDIDKLTVNDVLKLNAEKQEEFQSSITRLNGLQKGNFDIERYNQQKKMISKQKQLIVQQNKMIGQLKQQQKTSAIKQAKSSPRVSTTNTIPIKVLTEPKPSTVAPVPKRPKAVLAMEQRAQERLQKRLDLEERRKEKEKERLAKIQQEEEERLRQEELEKQERIKKVREEKRLKAQKEREKLEFQAWLKEARFKADAHYKTKLLSRYGLKPLMNVVLVARNKVQIADSHYHGEICSKIFNSWLVHVKNITMEANSKADALKRRHLIKNCFQNWKKYKEIMTIQEQKAAIHYNGVLKSKYLKFWERFAIDEKLRLWDYDEQARVYHEKAVMRHGLHAFRNNVKYARLEKERSVRLATIHMRVMEMLPDFHPETSLED